MEQMQLKRKKGNLVNILGWEMVSPSNSGLVYTQDLNTHTQDSTHWR